MQYNSYHGFLFQMDFDISALILCERTAKHIQMASLRQIQLLISSYSMEHVGQECFDVELAKLIMY